MRALLAALVVLFAAVTVSQAAPPARFSYQGKLFDSAGVPLAGTQSLFFSLYEGGDSSGGGTLVYQEMVTVTPEDGIVNHSVGSGTPVVGGSLSPSMFRKEGEMFLQVAVGSTSNAVLPRTRIDAVPFAMTSSDGDPRTPLSQPASLPLRITRPGSYYLTENITGTALANGIEITTSHVTLDLNGFAVLGVPGSHYGIRAALFRSNLENIVVKNGTVANWGYMGVSCEARNVKVTGLQVLNNNQGAISCTRPEGVLEDCLIRGNGASTGTCIYGVKGLVVRNCTISGNVRESAGPAIVIFAESNAVITGNVLQSNGAAAGALFGIYAGYRSVISSNKISENHGSTSVYGIKAFDECQVTDNMSDSNYCTDSTAGNAYGIDTGVRCTVMRNTSTANAGSGSGISHGIRTLGASVIAENHSARHNAGTGYGIFINGGGSKVVRNQTTGSSTAGIRLDSSGNYCADNLLDETTGISSAGTNTLGSGDHANIVF